MAITEPCFAYAIRFTTANPVLIVDAGSGDQTATLSVNTTTDYFMSGDGESDDLVDLFETALNTTAGTFTVALSERNIITITASPSTTLKWTNGSTTLDGTIFGWPSADVSGTTIVAPDQTKGFWTPGTAAGRVVTWREDTRQEPVTVGHLAEAVDGSSRGYLLTSSKDERMVDFHLLDREKVLTEYADATEPYGTLEYAWATGGIADGRPVRVYDDRSSRTSSSYSTYRTKSMERPWRKMDVSFLNRYEARFEFREV